MLSGHCIPTNEYWLEKLIFDLKDPNVAGVYGRQEPLSFSEDADKRDLAIVFGLDKKIQKKDTFFHNANSAFRRELWRKFNFDNEVKHIEDRLWGKEVIKAGYKLVYEPEASVYHYHGIHQNNHSERLKNIVRILEDNEVLPNNQINEDYQTSVIIPVNHKLDYLNGKSSIHYLAKSIETSKSIQISDAIICTNLPEVEKEAKKSGFINILNRPDFLVNNLATVDDVIKYTLENFDFNENYPDVVFYLSPRNPFRPNQLIDTMYSRFLNEGCDLLIPAYNEKRTIWMKRDHEIKRIEKNYSYKI